MIPHPWVALWLALAAFRLTRFVGWDDFPPVAVVRGWLGGENDVRQGVELYGNGVFYRRPTLTKFLHCAWCAGFWVTASVYILWLWFPRATLYGLAPFALSAVVGLIAKHLDP